MVPATAKCRQAMLMLLVAWSVLMPGAWSCSDVAMTNTSLYDAIISVRNYDFFAQRTLTLQFAVIPAKTTVNYTPLLGCESPSGLSPEQRRTKYGYVCVTAGSPELRAGFSLACGKTFDAKTYVGTCAEGFNTEGLSLGALTDQSQPMAPNATKLLGQKPGLYYNDIVAFILANYKTVAEVRKDFTPGNYRVVQNPDAFNILYKMSEVAATRINHYPIHDVTGASAVLEFSSDASGNYVWQVIDNPNAVITNSPGIQTQLQYSEQWQQSQINQFGALNGLVMTPGFCGVGWDITDVYNNNCNSMGRFTALSQLKKNVANTRFPDPEYRESPASNPDPAHQAITAALRIIEWVQVPGHWPKLEPYGPPPSGNTIIGSEEMTLMRFIKNHRRLIWYVRTAANEQWAKFDLKKIFCVDSLEKNTPKYEQAELEGEPSYHRKRRHSHPAEPPVADKEYDRYETDSSRPDHYNRCYPPQKPIFKLVGDILPPTRQWATDKTDSLLD